MDLHYRDLSAEEVVMVCTLLLSTTLIVMSPYVTLPQAAGTPVTTVAFAERPLEFSGAPDGVVPPVDPALRRPAVQSAAKGDEDFIPMLVAGNAGSDGSGDPAGAVRITKDVYAGGKRAGRLEVMVLPDGELLIQGRELKSFLAGPDFAGEATLARTLGNGQLSLRDLREAGIDLRYSPEDDSFRIVG